MKTAQLCAHSYWRAGTVHQVGQLLSLSVVCDDCDTAVELTGPVPAPGLKKPPKRGRFCICKGDREYLTYGKGTEVCTKCARPILTWDLGGR